jgi:hypothetical protein
VRRCEQAAGVLVWRTHVDQVLAADRRDHFVAEGADRRVLVLGRVRRGRPRDRVGDEWTVVQLPLLAAAVEQLHVLVPVQLEIPVRVGGEPVVVAAVEDDLVVVADAALGEQGLELGLVHEVPADRVLEVLLPIELDGPWDVTTVVSRGVLVHLNEDRAGGAEILLGPVGGDERGVATHSCSLAG